MKIVFMGTPDFAVFSLKQLIKEKFEVAAVFTKIDKPSKRGHKISPPPVKILAEKFNVPIFQPNNLKDPQVFSTLKRLNPDVIVVVAYGKILPKEILNLPKYGCVNLHASLLPKYRGAAPINFAIINGETETGVTTMLMDEGMDTGDILLKEEIDIAPNGNAGELHDKLKVIGADLLVKTLKSLGSKSIIPFKQPDKDATYSTMLGKDMALIDWNKSATNIHNLVRGLAPVMPAFTFLNEKRIKIHKTEVVLNPVKTDLIAVGKVISEEPFVVACGKGTLKIITLQPENKNKMSAEDFVRGHRDSLQGAILSNPRQNDVK